jgi:1-acyl-sn-glycerol-3-phosphate acyltransferase
MSDPALATASICSPILSFCRLTAYVAVTLTAAPLQALYLLLKLPGASTLPKTYHRMCCRALGLRVHRKGRQSSVHPTLFVANHSSYLDIAVLGSLIRGSFVAKAEIAGWPFFGWLAKLQRSVFVDRRPSQSGNHRDELQDRLEAGDKIILFPEGTSSDGNRVLPFKSALFAVAERQVRGGYLTVQPVSVAYARLDGMPMGRAMRPFFAWYGDMELASHMWKAAGLGLVTVVVHFHEPVSMDQFGSRKKMAEYCHAVVSRGLTEALTGRRQVPVPRSAEAVA